MVISKKLIAECIVEVIGDVYSKQIEETHDCEVKIKKTKELKNAVGF